MRASWHAAASIAAGGAAWLYTDSHLIALYTFLGGVFVDIDHIPDFLIQSGLKEKGIRRLWREFFHARLAKLYLVLHSYELLFLLVLAGRLDFGGKRMTGLAAGMLLHMALDQFSNTPKYGLKPYFYFLAARAAKNFRKEVLTKNLNGDYPP